jgi:hypothetical protein
MSCKAGPIVQRVLFYIAVIPLIVASLVARYIGLIVFLYCALLVPLTYVSTMLSYISLDSRRPTAQLITWCIYAIPLIDLLLSLTGRIISSFFRDLWHILSLSGARRYLQATFMDWRKRAIVDVPRVCIRDFLGTMIGLLVIALLGPSGQGLEIFALLIVLALASVAAAAFLKNLAYPWLALFRVLCSKTAARREAAAEPIPLDNFEAPTGGGKEPQKENGPSMFDPCRLWPMDDWHRFIDLILEPVQDRTFGVGFILAVLASGVPLAHLITCLVADRKAGPLAIIVLRVIFNIFAFPFIALCNISTLFTKWRNLTVKHKYIKKVKCITFGFIVLVFVLPIVYSIIVNFFFKPLVLSASGQRVRPSRTRRNQRSAT